MIIWSKIVCSKSSKKIKMKILLGDHVWICSSLHISNRSHYGSSSECLMIRAVLPDNLQKYHSWKVYRFEVGPPPHVFPPLSTTHIVLISTRQNHFMAHHHSCHFCPEKFGIFTQRLYCRAFSWRRYTRLWVFRPDSRQQRRWPCGDFCFTPPILCLGMGIFVWLHFILWLGLGFLFDPPP